MNHNITLRRTLAGTLTLVVPVIRYGRAPDGHYGPGQGWHLEQDGVPVEVHPELKMAIGDELDSRGLEAFGLLELLSREVSDPMVERQIAEWRVAS